MPARAFERQDRLGNPAGSATVAGTVDFTHRLSTRHALVTVLLALLFGLVSSLVECVADFRKERIRLEDSFSRIIGMVREPAAAAAYDLDSPLAQKVADGVALNRGLLSIRIEDERGHLLAQVERPGESSWLTALFRPVLDDLPVFAEDLVVRKPPSADQVVGHLQIRIDPGAVVSALQDSVVTMVVSNLIHAVILAVAIAVFFHHFTTKPLLCLVGAFRAIAPEQPIRQLVPIPHRHERDELAIIADAANRLILAFRAAIEERDRAGEELRALADALEARVQDRTAEAVAARRRAETALEELCVTQDSLVQAEKMAALAQLVGGVAHEINTPLGVALTVASYFEHNTAEINKRLESGGLKKSDLTDFLVQTREAATLLSSNLSRAADLVQSFKKVAVDQTSETRRSFDLAEYLGEIVSSLHPAFKKTPHAMTVDCPSGIVLDSYPGALFQVVTNFVMNSLHHAFDADAVGHLAIRVKDGPQNVVIEYSDDGKGIGLEDQRRIFEPFFTTARHKGGSGLGLHIVFNLVTQTLKGDIRCESRPGEGTRMIVTIPKVVG